MIAVILFWVAAILIVYTYVGFPLAVIVRGLLLGRPHEHEELTNSPTVSIVISAYNEAESIGAKLDNILSMEYPRDCLEIVIASDGSTDGTDAIVEQYKEHGVRLLSLPRVGKAAALNAAVNASSGELLVFSDANSMYKTDAIEQLVRPFGDPKVGGVAGNQIYRTEGSGGSSTDGERAYWGFDRMLKQFQGKAGNTLAATGAIYAIRRSLFEPIPDGVSDDLFTSTGVIARGYRLVFASEAIAYEPVAATSQVEFGRKVRVIMRSWRAFSFRMELFNPFRYKFYAIQLFSHKILRYLVVLPLLMLFFVSPFLWKTGWIYQMATIGQVAFYACALLGLRLNGTRIGHNKVFTIPFYFCMVNAASLVAIIRVLRGRQIKHWEPQRHVQTQSENITVSEDLMTGSDLTIKRHFAYQSKPYWLFLIALLGAIAIGFTATNQPLPVIGALVGILFLLALFRWPDAATLLVVFYIYTNVGPVLMNFHGVPSYVAMGFPVLLTIPLIWYILLRREKLIITPVFHLLLLLLVIYILGAVFSIDIVLASRKLVDYVFEGVLLYFFLTNVIRTPLMLKRVVWTLLISGALIGGLSLYQQITGTFDNTYAGFAQVAGSFGTGEENLQGEIEQHRLMGSVGEQNRYAQNMLMLVPLGLFQLWMYRSNKTRMLATILTGLIIIGGSLAFSRGAAVGFVMMILIFVLLRYIKFYQVVLLVLGAYLVLWMFPQYSVRLATVTTLFTDAAATDSAEALTEADGAIRGRVTDVLAAGQIFADHPLVGVGPDMVRYYTQDYSRGLGFRFLSKNPQAHSLFPGIAAEAGLLGLICFVLILYVPLRDLVRARRQWLESHPDWSYMATAFFQVLISYIVTGIFLHLSYMRFFYLMIALAVVASSFKATGTVDDEKTGQTVLASGV